VSRAGHDDVQIDGDAIEDGETVHRNGRPVADIFPVKAAIPAWKKPPQIRLSLGNLSLGDEVLTDRDEKSGSDPADEKGSCFSLDNPGWRLRRGLDV
jgi:antitoxin (DNA-binding transcriptional repressor) of toxin-antitoxin stability system